MNLREMIERLEELASEHGDECEVLMATNPNYPMQAAIAGLAVESPLDEIREIKEAKLHGRMMLSLDASDIEAMDAEIARLEGQKAVIYVLDGGTHGLDTPYASRTLWEGA